MAPKSKFYAIVGGFFLLIVLVSAAGFWLYYYQVRVKYADLRAHQAALQQEEENQDALKKLRGTVSEREHDIETIRATLYRSGRKDLDAHLAYLQLVEGLAAELQLTPFTMSSSDAGSQVGALSTRFTFTTSGTYQDLLKFLAMLEQLPVFTVVEQASLSGSGSQLSLNVTIAVATTQ